MLEKLRQLAIFAKTVEYGSFRSAARALQLSPSVVSHHITQLEEALGTPLLYRSTRRLSLTHDGEVLLASAGRMLDAAVEGLKAVSEASPQPSGALRVTAPAVLAQSELVDCIARFAIAYPNVQLTLDFTDTRRDLVSDGFDVAIRMGKLKDSTLKSKRLYDVDRDLVAASRYLEDKPAPATPSDIEDWNWIALSPVLRKKHTFSRPGSGAVAIRPQAQIAVNSAYAIRRLVRSGIGLGIVPSFLVESDLQGGEVRRVLPRWKIDPIAVYAVWQPNVTKQGLVSRFVNEISRTFLRR